MDFRTLAFELFHTAMATALCTILGYNCGALFNGGTSGKLPVRMATALRIGFILVVLFQLVGSAVVA